MTVFVCVDDKLGMMFNNRRQSRDSAVVSKVVEMSHGGRLLMNAYSGKLFAEHGAIIDENFIDVARDGDFCFVEDAALAGYDERITKLVLFKWNKVYPSDKKLDVSLEGRTLDRSFDFEGTSHDKVTCEVWVR